jgi:D-beta-D-heptose 7-phosphate kinase/D-beta-D-heptose 1-phosphate adenosyltransferase
MSAASFLPWKNAKKPVSVAIVGDIMLDEYLEGRVSRISPEAPVPVHLVSKVIHRAGGAANAALNVAKAGGEALLFGVCGDDAAAQDLKKLLTSEGISFDHVVIDPDRPTIRKTRVSASRQQIVRVDWEKLIPVSGRVESELLQRLKKTEWQAVLVSDYGKGGLTSEFLTALFALAKERNADVIVDPKGADFGRYRGAYAITPNRAEACFALGLDALEAHSREALGEELRQRFSLNKILVTLGAEGMYLHSDKPQDCLYLPANAREVYDVSGAGDTVAAMFALGRACKCEDEETLRIANTAAAIVVGKWGTQPVLAHELEAALGQESRYGGAAEGTLGKMKSKEAALERIGSISERNRRVVFTNGCFDILHAGHVTYLEKARALGDVLIVGVNSDRSVRKLKGAARPVVALGDRMRVLAALACVDLVVPFEEETPFSLIQFLIPNVLVKGADWAKGDIVGGALVERHGGKVTTIELVEGLSTTTIVERIKKGQGVDL